MVLDHGRLVPHAGAMAERTYQASTFKARCLALLDDVAETRRSVLVTKRGRPVARLVPVDDDVASTDGSVTLIATDDEDFFSTGEAWHAG